MKPVQSCRREIVLCLAFIAWIGGMPATGAVPSGFVDHVLEEAGIAAGVCSLLDGDDAALALELARTESFYVHLQDPSRAVVEEARRVVDVDGLYGKQIVVETGSPSALPYAENSIDLLLATQLTEAGLQELNPAEILRVLRPRGRAVLGSLKSSPDGVQRKTLRRWVKETDFDEAKVTKDEYGEWALVTKPPLDGTDNWSHWEHGPDNNPVSSDEVIKAPYMTQFLGFPFYNTMPAVTTAAGGRIFLANGHIAHHKREEPWLNTLLASNGYNGAPLWTRKLPDGYLVHRSAFVATDDIFYMISEDGNGCVMLDAETGNELDRILFPEHRGEWKWMAMQDNMLYVLIGRDRDPAQTTVVRSQNPAWSWGELSQGYYDEQIPWGFGNKILAYDLRREKVRWTHDEDQRIDARAMVMGGGNIYLYDPDSRLVCLNARTGKQEWANEGGELRELIEQPGEGLGSTPGFRTACFSLYTPEALYYEAQTRMNIVAVSTQDGSILWHRRKTTNNPNMIYADGKLLVGIGPEGNTLAVNPLTGDTLADLGFRKRSCVRLTATPDSFFCRGWIEGMTRYDRETGQILFNGAFRPSCNDGVIGANGLLYAGPWPCDCNLSLMGKIGMCSAGDFQFEREARNAERLETGPGNIRNVEALTVTQEDWGTYRGNNSRTGATNVEIPDEIGRIWVCNPDSSFAPTAPVAAGGLVLLGGSDGKMRAIDTATGDVKWTFLTAGPIQRAASIWNGRAYFGSGDGYVYCVEAATGRFLWRYRAAPVERRIMVYGALGSTWPANTGVLVEDGIAYAGAGIIDTDGTYVYALDAITGELKWQNNSSGHLDKDLRKGASAQGILTTASGRLWMAAGNAVSPAAYDLSNGEYVGRDPGNGSPQANRGEEIAVFHDDLILSGGRLRYSSRDNVVNPGRFEVAKITGGGTGNALRLNAGRVPPAWNDDRTVYVPGRFTAPLCVDKDALVSHFQKGDAEAKFKTRWSANALNGRDTIALAITPTQAIAICETPRPRQITPRWTLCALSLENGSLLWEQNLPGKVRPGGLLIDRAGRAIVALDDGRVACFGDEEATGKYVDALIQDMDSGGGKSTAIRRLRAALDTGGAPGPRQRVIQALRQLGFEIGDEAKKAGYLVSWKLLGPVPWDMGKNNLDKTYVGEPNPDLDQTYSIGGRSLAWRTYVTDHQTGKVDLAKTIGSQAFVAAYAYAELELDAEQDAVLRLGTNDGYICWFNGEEVGRFDGGRGFVTDQDTIHVKAKKGVNTILLKVSQHGGVWAYGARLTNEKQEPVVVSTR